MSHIIDIEVLNDTTSSDLYDDDIWEECNWRNEPKLGIETAGKFKEFCQNGSIDNAQKSKFTR